jgi:hypothetical protein
MNKETFLLMINSQLCLLPLVLIVHMSHWFVCFRLQLKMKNINPDFKLIFFIFFASCYSILGKQVISDSFYIIGIIMLYIIVLTIYKINILDILWLFVGLYLLMAVGVFIIATPLTLIPEIKNFLFVQPFGNCIGSIIEIIFPLILLIFSYKFNYTKFLSKNKYYKIEVISIICIFIGILLLYNSSLLFLFLLPEISFSNILYHIIFEWIIFIFLTLTFFYFKKEINSKEKMLDRIEETIEENKKLQEELNKYNK